MNVRVEHSVKLLHSRQLACECAQQLSDTPSPLGFTGFREILPSAQVLN